MSERVELYAQANLDIENDDLEIVDIGYSKKKYGTSLRVLDSEKNIIVFSMERSYGEPEDAFMSRARFKAAGLIRHLWDHPIILCHIVDREVLGIARIFTVDQIPKYDWGRDFIVITATRNKGENINDVIERVKKEVNEKLKKQGSDGDG